jgi:hypothetical protein
MAKDPPAEPKPEPKKENLMESLKVGDLVEILYSSFGVKGNRIRLRKKAIVVKKTPKSVSVQNGHISRGRRVFVLSDTEPHTFKKTDEDGRPIDKDYIIVRRIKQGLVTSTEESDTEAEGETESESE